MRFSSVGSLQFFDPLKCHSPHQPMEPRSRWSRSGWPSYRSPSRLMKSRWRSRTDRIIHVGDRKRAIAVVVGDQFPAADLLEPSGMVRTALVGRTAHHPERQLLPRVVRLLEHLVQESVVDLPGLRFQFPPAPAGVLDGRGNPGRQVLVLPCWCGGTSPSPCQGSPGSRRFPPAKRQLDARRRTSSLKAA